MALRVYSMKRLVFLVVLCLFFGAGLSGCSKLLPRSKEVTLSKWHSFERLKNTYDRIEAGDTVSDLAALGFDLEKTPNMQLLNYTELASMFQTMSVPGLAPELQECLSRPDACQAYTYDMKRLRSKRVGNFWADLFNFHRKTEISGWEFKMLLVLSHGEVVYKLWSGTPAIETCREERNPLGLCRIPEMSCCAW